MFFSIIIPVYNRPDEIRELLESLVKQCYKNFEVIIIEDGSEVRCDEIVTSFEKHLSIRYIFQKNTGQGFARNKGMELALGDYYVLFDSDCVIPVSYLEIVYQQIQQRALDAYGGPDQADQDFSPFQKAINYSMTSLFTTGGIRGKLKDPGKYQARGFNMGISKRAFQATGGFIDPNKAEDIELSIRLKKMGFKLELIKEAFVYHKRRNTFSSFLKQSYSFGRNRVNVSRFHPEAVQLVHFLPLFFLLGVLSIPLLYIFNPNLYLFALTVLLLWCAVVILDSTIKNHSLYIGLISLPVAVGQLFSYGLGLGVEGVKRLAKG